MSGKDLIAQKLEYFNKLKIELKDHLKEWNNIELFASSNLLDLMNGKFCN
jgi:hypothetical protein